MFATHTYCIEIHHFANESDVSRKRTGRAEAKHEWSLADLHNVTDWHLLLHRMFPSSLY